MGEILFLGILALIVIGPKDLPVIARKIGQFMTELRRTTNSMTDDFKAQMKVDLDQSYKQTRAEKNEPAADPQYTYDPNGPKHTTTGHHESSQHLAEAPVPETVPDYSNHEHETGPTQLFSQDHKTSEDKKPGDQT